MLDKGGDLNDDHQFGDGCPRRVEVVQQFCEVDRGNGGSGESLGHGMIRDGCIH